MRLANRLLSTVFAAALAAAGAVVAVEILLAALHDPYWILPWPRWYQWALHHTWTATPVEVTCWVLASAGLVVLVIAWTRYRPIAIALQASNSEVKASVRRTSLERSLQRAAQGVDGIAKATVAVSRQTVRVKARSNRRDTVGLRDGVSGSVGARLGSLRLAQPPKVRVQVTRRSQ